MIEPTETSRLRVIRITACAPATIIRIDEFDRIALRLVGVTNCGRKRAKAAPSRIRKARTPLTRKRSANWPSVRCGASAASAAVSADMGRLARVAGGGHHDRGLIGGFWIELGDELAFGDDQDAVADCEHLRQIRGDQQYRQALVGELRDHPVDLGLRGD